MWTTLRPLARPLALVAVLLTAFLVAKFTGVLDAFDRTQLTEAFAGAGGWGVLAFVVVFTVGLSLSLPGLLFVAVAILAYGPGTGAAVGFLGGLVAFSASFYFARLVGGKSLGALSHPLAQKVLGALDARPVMSVAALRVLFQFSPPVTYALAMTNLRYRKFIVGSAIGIVPGVAALALFTEAFL